MGTINDVREMALSLMVKQFTINVNGKEYILSASGIGYRFEFGKRKRSFGTCFYNKRVIQLSLPLCAENLDKVDSRIQNTMLHELAHAFSVHIHGNRFGSGHGDNWQSIAKQIGCDGKRCFSSDSVNIPKSKYSLVCDHCGYESPKHRKVTKTYACARCCNAHNGGKFTVDYKLRFVVNS